MPSFDIVSEVNMHEVTNAVDQANKEVSTRFDFKNSSARFTRENNIITMYGDNEFQLKQMLDILYSKLNRRGIDLACIQKNEPVESGKGAKQDIILRQGIESLLAKKIVRIIKEMKIKVQAAIQGEKIRVSGGKKDDLQKVIKSLKASEFDMPLQFENYRD